MLIATHPDIPSSRLERLEGYDVRFKLNIGKRNYSVFYQQKISNYNEKLHGPNRRFYECHEAPYFRFQLTNHQHNILHELSQYCTDVYYSAPIFHERDVLADYADNGTIINRACLQSPFQDRKVACFCVIPGTDPESRSKRPLDFRFHGNDNSRFCAFCPNVNTP